MKELFNYSKIKDKGTIEELMKQAINKCKDKKVVMEIEREKRKVKGVLKEIKPFNDGLRTHTFKIETEKKDRFLPENLINKIFLI